MREAGVMLIIKDGLMLSVSRKHDPSKYGLAGGKVEPNETPKQGAMREAFEETGIIVNDCELIYQRVEPAELPDGLPFYTYCFFATDWFGDPKALEGGTIKWFTAKEITSEECTGGFHKYIKDILDNLQTKFPNIYIQGE